MTNQPATPATDELLPCPFCGGEASFATGYQGATHAENARRYVECDECGVTAGWGMTDADVAPTWNRRTTDRKKLDELRRYARHDLTCGGYVFTANDCTCGLSALLTDEVTEER